MIGLQEGPHAGDLDPLTIEALMLRRGWRWRWPAPGDLVRMTIGSCVVLLAALAARRSDPSLVEANIFRLVNQFPSATGAPLLGVMQVGALAAVPVVAVAALFARRRQLARAIVVGGVTAWGLAKLLQHCPSPHSASIFMHQREVAQLTPRRPSGLFFRQPFCLMLFRFFFQMELEFLAELSFLATALCQPT